jgi:DNA-binding response OmpR family regulator
MAAPARILVVDDDAWILRMVTTVLEKRGYEIFVAGDGEEGLEKARALQPDLVITDVMMPRRDGWSLVKQLRSAPELAFVPVIFLTALGADEDRIRGFRLGADDYLPKPFRFEELDLRVAKALKRAHPEAPTRASVRAARSHGAGPSSPRGASSSPGIRGTLDQLGLSSLLIVLEMERKSGVLVLQTEAPARLLGRVFLRDGRVVRALLEGVSENHLAVYTMLTWTEGTFEFTALDVDMEDEVRSSTTALLMEGARRIDEEEERAARGRV